MLLPSVASRSFKPACHAANAINALLSINAILLKAVRRPQAAMRASLIVLLTAGTAATTNPAAQRAVRYRGGETAHKKTLDEFLRHLGGGELEAVWEKAPKLWRRVDGCGPELFSFDDAVKGAEAGLLDNAAVADGAQAEEGRWVAEKAGAASADDLKRALAKGTVFFNGAGLAFPNLAALGAACHRFLGLPANINVYVTDPKREVSVSPHSDAQNVLVFQCCGMKHWRVWPCVEINQ